MEHEADPWDYKILINDAGQHSLWPEHKEPPAGWRPVGPIGEKAACITWIEAHWTDLRPRSLQGGMNEA